MQNICKTVNICKFLSPFSGVVRALEKNDKVQDVVLAEHQPSDNIAITSWEQRYSTMLPNEIKDFYLGR